jgi:peptide/nickel transport system substrate-binding protein
MNGKKWLSVGLVLFLIAPLAMAQRIPKDVLVVGDNTEVFISFDPAVAFEITSCSYVENVYANLTKIVMENGAFKTVPYVAERWEEGRDGKTWTFYLNKKAVFDTGAPVKASDVVYSLTRVITLNKSPAWLLSETLGLTVDGIKAVNDSTVTIVTNGAPANVVLSILGNSVGGIVNEKVVRSHEVNGDMGSTWLTDHSAGAGPYVIKEWKRKIQLVLMANSKYWRAAPAIKTVIIRDMPEATDRFLALKKGDVDIAWELTPEQAVSIQKSTDVSLETTPDQSMEYLGMNASWGPFKDVRVRTAVKYAIDYDAIVNKVREGFGVVNQQFLAVGYFGYKESNPYKHDVARAKKLLSDAGYPNGFEVELVTNEAEVRRSEAVILQSNLADVGIKVNIVVMQASQMYDKYRKQGLQMILASWGIDYPDADALANPFANHRVKQLAWRNVWLDDKAADMVEAAAQERDEAKRAKTYQDLTAYWQANSPFAMLFQPVRYWGISKAVKGYSEACAGFCVHYDLTKISK